MTNGYGLQSVNRTSIACTDFPLARHEKRMEMAGFEAIAHKVGETVFRVCGPCMGLS